MSSGTIKIKCNTCDSMILPATAERNNGLCAPCKRKISKKEVPTEAPDFRGKYDDASWHYGGDFPKELPHKNGATHMGMFLAWAINNNLIGDSHINDSQKDIDNVKKAVISGRDFFIKNCDEKLTDEDLNELGNKFARYYYSTNLFSKDYSNSLGTNLETIYHVKDTWDNYHKLAPYIQKQYEQWLAPTKKWWELW